MVLFLTLAGLISNTVALISSTVAGLYAVKKKHSSCCLFFLRKKCAITLRGVACVVPTACGMTDRRKWVCMSSYDDCSFMFCRFLTFSDGALYYEVGSTACGLTGTYLKTFFYELQ